MSNCEACQSYERNPLSGHYIAACIDCNIRSIARGPAFFEAQRTGVISKPYRDALERAFHGNWREGHEAVKRWAEKFINKPTNGA